MAEIETLTAGGVRLDAAADTALRAAAGLWLLTAVVGQWMFVYYIGAYYGGSTVHGEFERWNQVLYNGLIEGDIVGNLFLAAHIFLAFVISAGGALQLIPQIRARALPVHRWNGRIYIVTAFVISIAGLYMVYARGVVGGPLLGMGNTLNAVLIMLCAAMTWRYARARDITRHRRWALRTFLLASGVWFFRIGFGLWIFLNNGSAPGHNDAFNGPFDFFLAVAHTLLPVAVLELYLFTQDRAGAPGRLAMAAGLMVCTVATGIGIFMAAQIFWLPRLF